MIWTKNQVIGCRFENNPHNANGDQFTEVGPASYRNGEFGREIDFSGGAAYVELIDENYLGSRIDGAAAITLSVWIEVESTPNRQTILAIPNHFPSSGSGAIMEIRENTSLEIRGRSRGTFTAGNPNETLSVPNIITIGQKIHAVGIWDYTNKELILYVDGEEVGRQSNLGFPTDTYDHSGGSTGNPCMIGAHWNGTREMDGYLDEMRLFRKALSLPDIKRLYHNLHPLNG